MTPPTSGSRGGALTDGVSGKPSNGQKRASFEKRLPHWEQTFDPYFFPAAGRDESMCISVRCDTMIRARASVQTSEPPHSVQNFAPEGLPAPQRPHATGRASFGGAAAGAACGAGGAGGAP